MTKAKAESWADDVAATQRRIKVNRPRFEAATGWGIEIQCDDDGQLAFHPHVRLEDLRLDREQAVALARWIIDTWGDDDIG